MKIFVSAYACEPNLGSEIGVGWHWVLEMSKYFELWVLTRESNRQSIEPWIEKHAEYANIHWLYYDLPRWARWWKKGLRGVHLYYNLWTWLSNRIVKATMQQNNITVFHHLTYGNALWKVSRYGQQQTFVWGPIGGLETLPAELTANYPLKSKCIEALRRMAVKLLPLNSGFRCRCKKADLIICKTEATLHHLPANCQNKAILMTDVACEKGETVTSSPANTNKTVLMVGRPQAWRGFDLGIEAFAKALKTHPDLHLTLVGCKGSELGLNVLAQQLGIADKVQFLGKVSHEAYVQLMSDCTIVLNPALKEGAVTVAFDAISHLKPLVCVSTGGYTRNLKADMSTVVEAGLDREQTINALAAGLCRFCNPEARKMAEEKDKELAQQLSWEEKGKAIYNAILEATK